MAYDATSLSQLEYANGFTLWHYRSADTAVTIAASGYFNVASHMLRTGDMIFATVDTGGTPQNGIFVVDSNTGGVVDASNLTVFS